MRLLLVFLTSLLFLKAQSQKDSLGYSVPFTTISAKWVEPEKIITPRKEEPTPIKIQPISLDQDVKFIEKLPTSYDDLTPNDLTKISIDINKKLEKLNKEREELLKKKADTVVINSKNTTIKTLKKEKTIIDLTLRSGELKSKAINLQIQRDKLKKFSIVAGVICLILILAILALIQRKTIKVKDKELEIRLKDIIKKNSFLSFAAKIIRHDMHSGINTYIPRGLTSLEKRLTEEQIKQLKIESSLQLIKNGLQHTQRVYKIVYEFTNLVKPHAHLEKEKIGLNELISKFLDKTSYSNQVKVGPLPTIEVNDLLFSTAIDNLIKNGIKYNDSENKEVKIYMEGKSLVVEDNGRGFSKEDFEKCLFSSSKNEELSLGLKIANAIIIEHGFEITCQKLATGTKFIIKLTSS